MTTQTTLAAVADFHSVVQSRRSVRRYEPDFRIPREELETIIERAAKAAPSSSNMQPWRFLVVTDPELKQRMLPVANNQQQVVNASAVLVLLADKQMYEKADEIYGAARDAGYMTEELSRQFAENSRRTYSSIPAERLLEIIVFDAGLVAMQLMLQARAMGYDTVPMGGYNREALRELLAIPDRYHPTILLPIGKAAVPGHPTARLPISGLTYWNTIE
ncbi:putative NAD(P)H nitroreductase YdgI [Paenibacillus sp. J31TS4]|uniref:nitroreductase family protein n=1 Tax=Paenibacillus sp. J31TS4 TaxID=2807195 RepID=UPI001B2BF27E|nr:nitroreductase family protein [Paenibacillus sp. J31TS4]GIP39502.1 putative NAD(P)H nitroreductase YdgI [Paenibacillus sp. J31TS4]